MPETRERVKAGLAEADRQIRILTTRATAAESRLRQAEEARKEAVQENDRLVAALKAREVELDEARQGRAAAVRTIEEEREAHEREVADLRGQLTEAQTALTHPAVGAHVAEEKLARVERAAAEGKARVVPASQTPAANAAPPSSPPASAGVRTRSTKAGG